MFSSTQFAKHMRDTYSQNIANINQLIESGQSLTTEQLTQVDAQRKQMRVLFEALGLWLDKFDASRAIDAEIVEEVEEEVE